MHPPFGKGEFTDELMKNPPQFPILKGGRIFFITVGEYSCNS
jgi:hypothetical protein